MLLGDVMNGRQTIYVLSYPKSGGTWLARLLGDALNSPVGGIAPSEDDKAVATEGQDRPGSYYIRHGHAVPVETGAVLIPDRFGFAYKHLTNERIVILIRDPRDVAVSAACYWGKDITATIRCMGEGEWPLTHGSGWVKWVESWENAMHKSIVNSRAYWINYKHLIINPIATLHIFRLHFHLDFVNDLQSVVTRQSFTARRAWTEQHGDSLNYGKDFQLRFLRKGIIGDWQDNFTLEHRELAEFYFGDMMRELGYVESKDWVYE